MTQCKQAVWRAPDLLMYSDSLFAPMVRCDTVEHLITSVSTYTDVPHALMHFSPKAVVAVITNSTTVMLLLIAPS